MPLGASKLRFSSRIALLFTFNLRLPIDGTKFTQYSSDVPLGGV